MQCQPLHAEKMNNYLGSQHPADGLRNQMASQQRRQRDMPSPTDSNAAGHVDPSTLDDTPMLGGDSLDEIIRNNSHELNRRRSIPQQFSGHIGQSEADRRLSMMEFPDGSAPFKGFHYANMNSSDNSAMMNNFTNGGARLGLPNQSGAFSQPTMMSLDDPSAFSTISPDMIDSMMGFSTLDGTEMSADPSSLDVFGGPNLGSQFSNTDIDHVAADFPMDMDETVPLSGSSATTPGLIKTGDGDEDMTTVVPTFRAPSRPAVNTQSSQTNVGLMPFQPTVPPSLSREPSNTSTFHSPVSATPAMTPTPSQRNATPATPATAASPQEPKQKNIYSKSGFDMIRALYYVATRPTPEVHLGAVDMSCAFVVCDVTQNDCPIIYVSDNFQNLTGYSRYEIMGQNCRFLQAPDGRVEAGTRREFVENDAVFNLKRKIAEGKEVQQSLINYRKGGKPFLNLLTMIPIPWDQGDEIRFFVGFQIDLVECPDAISGQEMGGVQVNYKHSEIQQYIWNPPNSSNWEPENGQTLGVDDVSTLLQQSNPKGAVSDWHKQSWDKMLLENADDVVHVLSLKGIFLYLSPSCKKVLEYDTPELVGNTLSSICHPSDIVPVTRELKDSQAGGPVNIVFRMRRKSSGYTWFESHGSLFIEQGKGRKCIILVGRKRPVFALHRRDLEANGGIGDSELWTKLSTSGLFLFVSSNVRSLLDLQPENLEGTSIQDLMRKESRAEFGRAVEKARRGKIVTCKHEVQNRRGQVLQAQTILYPGDAAEGQKPTFLLAQTKLIKASSRTIAPATPGGRTSPSTSGITNDSTLSTNAGGLTPSGGRIAEGPNIGIMSSASGGAITLGSQDAALASDDNIFDELQTTRCTSWQYELRQMEKMNRLLAEELAQLLSSKKKRKRRKGNDVRACANCRVRESPEWRRGPSGKRDLCNSCGLRWAKQMGRVSPRNSSRGGNNDTQSKKSSSPVHSSPLHHEMMTDGEAAAGETTPNRADGTPGKAGENSALKGPQNPPPSQPLLEGGSGFRGSGMEMTSIREEREMST